MEKGERRDERKGTMLIHDVHRGWGFWGSGSPKADKGRLHCLSINQLPNADRGEGVQKSVNFADVV